MGPIPQHEKLVDQPQLKPSDQQLKSFNQLKQSVEQPDGDVVHQLKSAAEQQEDRDKQLKSAEHEEELNPAAELKPIEKQAAGNGDVKIHVDAPPEKTEVKEEEEVKSEESRIKIEAAADDDEE